MGFKPKPPWWVFPLSHSKRCLGAPAATPLVLPALGGSSGPARLSPHMVPSPPDPQSPLRGQGQGVLPALLLFLAVAEVTGPRAPGVKWGSSPLAAEAPTPKWTMWSPCGLQQGVGVCLRALWPLTSSSQEFLGLGPTLCLLWTLGRLPGSWFVKLSTLNSEAGAATGSCPPPRLLSGVAGVRAQGTGGDCPASETPSGQHPCGCPVQSAVAFGRSPGQ